MTERCVIVGGADIGNYEHIVKELRSDDFLIYCDSGLKHMNALGAMPNLIVGDFDSHENPMLPIETIVLPREKDDTDTVYALKEAISRGYSEFLIIGAVGARLDHTIGNVSILLMLHSRGLHGKIYDDYSEMEIVSEKPVRVGCEYPYFSLLNITGRARGISIRNARYPLDNAEITTEYQYGISNEPLSPEGALVSVADGELLLVKILNA